MLIVDFILDNLLFSIVVEYSLLLSSPGILYLPGLASAWPKWKPTESPS